ncbi:chymotrypsin family serine protease [Nakamurella panacisegetis]|nr:hypothetical protein [Nakamurella panacisegetis]
MSQTVVNDDGSLTVQISGPVTSSLLASAAALVGPVAVHLETVAHSVADLQKVQDQISLDQAYWRSQGASMVQYGPDSSTNKISIVLNKYDSAIAAEIIARYGSDVVSVSTESMAYPSRRATRGSDFPPWSGGDLLINISVICSGAFMFRDANGADFMLTAGHCGSNGDLFQNNTRVVGHGSNSNFQDHGGYDSLLIPTGGVALVWGGNSNGTSRYVSGYNTSDSIGGKICVDGAVTGEVCNTLIQANGKCITFSDGVETCQLSICHNASAVTAVDGDSGGPVETLDSNGNSLARGEIIGSTADKHTTYYTPVRYIMSLYHITPLVI